MTEKIFTLFVTTRPSRAGELQESSGNVEIKRMLEESWADSLGIDVAKLKGRGNGTGSTCEQHLTSSTMVGSESVHDGVVDDCTVDHETDSQTITMTDDLQNDGGTGGIIDIPFG